MKKLFFIIIIANFLFADVIYFTNGDIDDGLVSINGERVTISTKDKKGSYGVSTGSIKYIEYGIWIKNLDPKTQAIAKESKKIKNVKIGGAKGAIKNITEKLPENVSDKFSVSKFNGMPKKIHALGYVFIAILFILILVAAVCKIILLIDAFKYSLGWGFASLFVPFVLLIYLFLYYNGSKGKMFFWMFAPILWILFAIIYMTLTAHA